MNKLNEKGIRLIWIIGLFTILCIGIIIVRKYQGNIKIETYVFTESAKELQNPRRGFYNLYRFMITDEVTNFEKMVQELYVADENTKLTLVEINLQNYRNGTISRAGIKNINKLFEALSHLDKQLIVRFVYDWDGRNEEYEPENIEIILGHMEQLGNVLQEFNGQIFILQGLFIGNWGEMNNTKYDGEEELLCLAEKLDNVVEPSIYLAVRTPAQWRMITGGQDVSEEMLRSNSLAGRISLYNDGMLGSESDYGTYEIWGYGKEKILGREKELTFQDTLCRWVPNGGEVIDDNVYNDFENAVNDLARMHVTYLNKGHDVEVLEKWRKTTITEEGCYKGMDGYTYIERHLGYRLLIDKVDFSNNSFTRNVKINVKMKNIGFAPLYAKPEVGLVLYDENQKTYLLYEMEGDLCRLAGGNEKEESLILTADIPTERLMDTKYEVYFFITDSATGEKIFLANEAEMEEYGYSIGNIEINNWTGR